MDSGKHVASQVDELAQPRSRSLGVLTGILVLLVLFSFSWYFFFSKTSSALPAADMTDTTSLSDTDPFYMLLMGSDSRKNTALYVGRNDDESHAPGAADTIILVRIDPRAHLLTLVSIPRNTVAPGEVAPIGNALQENDMERVAAQAQAITGVSIPYYAMTTFTGFQQIFDTAEEGVIVDVQQKISAIDPATGEEVQVPAGKRQLVSDQAIALARSSDQYAGGFAQQDAVRQENVRNLLQALITYIAQLPEEQVRSCVTVLSKSLMTNMDHSLLVSLVLDYAQHSSQYTVYSTTGPVGSQEANEFMVPADEQAWERIMEVVDAGGDPAESAAEAQSTTDNNVASVE